MEPGGDTAAGKAAQPIRQGEQGPGVIASPVADSTTRLIAGPGCTKIGGRFAMSRQGHQPDTKMR